MAKPPSAPLVQTFADHSVITPPNQLRKAIRYVEDGDLDDPIARAEQALVELSGEFADWMAIEADRLSAAHAMILAHGFTEPARDELFRAAHDIKGGAATFGYAAAGTTAESLCRIIEHAPDLNQVPTDLILHHVQAIQAIVREQTGTERERIANTLSAQLRRVADEFLTGANQDRPDHLEAILAPSVAPDE